jgi:hypothetical protein
MQWLKIIQLDSAVRLTAIHYSKAAKLRASGRTSIGTPPENISASSRIRVGDLGPLTV